MAAFHPLQTLGDLIILRFMADRRLSTLRTLFAILAATSATYAVAQVPSATTEASLQRAIERGKLMYLYDQAAWLTSDDLIAHLPPDRRSEVGGWIVTPGSNGLHVDYVGKDKAADLVVYAADVNGRTVSHSIVYPASAEPALKEPALRMVRALRSAWTAMSGHPDWQPCTNARFNTIVLPPDKDGVVPVYFLTPQTETGNFPFGGHYEVDIAADGTTKFSRAFTRSCIPMTEPTDSSGSTPTALVVTHLLDSHPTEIHVFEQYYVGIPLFVGTGPKSLWKVDGGRIEDMSAMLQR